MESSWEQLAGRQTRTQRHLTQFGRVVSLQQRERERSTNTNTNTNTSPPFLQRPICSHLQDSLMLRMEDVSNSNTATPDSVLQRLDRLDTRLKQLEEKQRLQVVPESYFSRDLYRPAESTSFSQQCRPLSSALQEVHFKGTLMDRLRLLETRILQISYELDKGDTASSSIKESDEIGLLQHVHDRKRHMFSSGAFNRRPNKLSDKFHKSLGRSPNLEAKELKEGSSVARQNKCRKEKQTGNNRACRRWFAIGC